MSTTVHVKGISHETTEKEVKDFFSFCGKINSISVTPESDGPDAQKSATVTFEKETAAKTALLLDNTQLGKSQVHVTTASTLEDVASKAGAAVSSSLPDDHIAQEDKPRTRIVAEYLAHGYSLSDNVINRAIEVDKQHGFSSRFTSALSGFDEKYKATDKAKSVDSKYGVTDKALSAWGGLNSYFEKALNTPTGQRVRTYYMQGDKQVRDVHNEARRLADLKAGKANEPEPVPGTDKTVCKCGGSEGVCGCAPGHCNCANCAKSDQGDNQPEPVKGTDKTVCKCGGSEGSCPCPAGHCACASCGKSSEGATTEAKEAAQASGQQLPAGSV
ncbi:Protein vip1 [Exophiala xenobiotica]|nr:Protein vip1 [Exophiala xenobiotica]